MILQEGPPHTPAKLSKLKPGPKYTDGSGNNFVGPADFATIYNTAPLLANGIKWNRREQLASPPVPIFC